MSMTWLRYVLRFVLAPLSIPLIRNEIRSLQRDVWRIDKKVNRHISPNSETPDTPGSLPNSITQAYPYLERFSNPWVNDDRPRTDNGKGPRPRKKDMAVDTGPGQ